MKPEMKKLIIANLPYLLFVYLFGKLGQTYRLAAGADLSEKLLHLADGFSLAFESAAPSFHLFDLAVGVAGAVALRLMVYCKSTPPRRPGGRPPYRLPYSRCSFITASTSGGSTSGHCSRGIFPLRMSLDAQG